MRLKTIITKATAGILSATLLFGSAVPISAASKGTSVGISSSISVGVPSNGKANSLSKSSGISHSKGVSVSVSDNAGSKTVLPPKALKMIKGIFKKSKKVKYNATFKRTFSEITDTIPSGTKYTVKKTKKYTVYTAKKTTKRKDGSETEIIKATIKYVSYKNGRKKFTFTDKRTRKDGKETISHVFSKVINMKKNKTWTESESHSTIFNGVSDGISEFRSGVGNTIKSITINQSKSRPY